MIDKKIKNNAFISYFFMAPFFLLPSKNKYINNEFVKSHSKNAIVLQILLLVIFSIFIFLGLLKDIEIIGLKLNHLLTQIISVLIFSIMGLGMKKAIDGEYFSIFKLKGIGEIKSEFKEVEISEKDKLFQTLSLIPFLGIILGQKNELYSFSGKISSIFGFISVFLLFLGKENSLSILGLLYLIIIFSVGVYNFTSNNGIKIDSNIPNNLVIRIYLRVSIRYILLIPFNKEFISFKDNLKIVVENRKNEIINNGDKIKELENSKLPTFLSYIPGINLIMLAFIKSTSKYHILNGMYINMAMILIIASNISNKAILFLLFPIFYGIANTDKLYYKLPYLGDLVDIFAIIFGGIQNLVTKFKEKNKEEKTFSGKTKDL